MSYCVNCGVELEKSLNHCPLCNTPVINPNKLIIQQKAAPFPTKRGQVETVKRKDLAVLFTIILLSTGITCGLLNIFLFSQSLWSIPIIGICAIIWVFIVPIVIYTKLSVYISVLLDGMIVGVYLYLITYVTTNDRWFYGIGLPLVVLVTLIAEVIAFLYKHFRASFLGTALYFVVAVSILCVGIEALVDYYLYKQISLLWSAIVLTVCSIITIALITLLSKKRLRNAVRRRLHF